MRHKNTQRPLRVMVPDILAYVKIQQQNQTIFERKVLDIYEGQLQRYVEDSLRTEYSTGSAKTAIERIAPINILPQVIDKISQVYTLGVTRTVSDGNETDIEMVGFYEKSFGLDSKLNVANRLVNLFQYLAIEPFVDNNEAKLRILPPTDFTVFTDDIINPTEPTVFIKYMGKIQPDTLEPSTTTDGRKLNDPETVVLDVDLFLMYSNTEILAVDANGSIRNDVMLMMKNPKGINPLGRIPFVYVNTSDFELIPTPNQDRLTMPILIPKLLTDLNYAVKFQSHAIMYSIDLDMTEMPNSPDSIWMLKTEGDTVGTLNTIKPDVDVDKVLKLIDSTLKLWLASLGAKSSGTGGISTDSAQSGIAKAIDEVDATNIRNDQKKAFAGVETDLWDLVADMNELWIETNELTDAKLFTKDFAPVTTFEDADVLVDEATRISTLKAKEDNGYTSHRRAMAEANPELNAEEIVELMAEIEAEKTERSLNTGHTDDCPDENTGHLDDENTGHNSGHEDEDDNKIGK